MRAWGAEREIALAPQAQRLVDFGGDEGDLLMQPVIFAAGDFEDVIIGDRLAVLVE